MKTNKLGDSFLKLQAAIDRMRIEPNAKNQARLARVEERHVRIWNVLQPHAKITKTAPFALGSTTP
jgi:hypothetical protein